MKKQNFINEQAAIDFLFENENVLPFFDTKKEYLDYLEKKVEVRMSKNGKEYFTVKID